MLDLPSLTLPRLDGLDAGGGEGTKNLCHTPSIYHLYLKQGRIDPH